MTHLADLSDAWLEGSLFEPARHRWIVETLMSTDPVWSGSGRTGQTVVLLGDTVYSLPVIDRIMAYRGPMVFFGHEKEIFALSFVGTQQAKLRRMLKIEVEQAEAGAIGKLRSLWWRWSGLEYGSQQVGGVGFHRVSDWSSDVDTPGQYETFLGRVVAAGKLDGG